MRVTFERHTGLHVFAARGMQDDPKRWWWCCLHRGGVWPGQTGWADTLDEARAASLMAPVWSEVVGEA